MTPLEKNIELINGCTTRELDLLIAQRIYNLEVKMEKTNHLRKNNNIRYLVKSDAFKKQKYFTKFRGNWRDMPRWGRDRNESLRLLEEFSTERGFSPILEFRNKHWYFTMNEIKVKSETLPMAITKGVLVASLLEGNQ